MSPLPSPSSSHPQLPQPNPSAVNPLGTIQAQTKSTAPRIIDYGDIPKIPRPLPFERIDTHSIKQKLHDVLGEDGLPYWKALNGYLLGQLAKSELESMVKNWFKGDKLDLHNTLLLSLLNNASIPPTLYTPIISSTSYNKKRKRVAYDDAEYDVDEESIQPKSRVQNWILGLNGRERSRIRRSVLGKQNNGNNTNGSGTGVDGEVDLEDELNGLNNRRYSAWGNLQTNALVPPLAIPTRQLPSSAQLSLRLSQYAKNHNLALAPDMNSEIGEFLSVGLDTHLEDILHGMVHLTGINRPGIGTIRIPELSISQVQVNRSPQKGDGGEAHPKLNGINNTTNKPKSNLPKVDLNSINHLLILNPNLNPTISPSLFKLQSGQTHSTQRPAPVSPNDPISVSLNGISQSPYLSSRMRENTAGGSGRDRKTAVMNKQTKLENITNNLVNSGLLKLDKAGSTEQETNAKKEKKHNLHWKYEDPAIILKDILG